MAGLTLLYLCGDMWNPILGIAIILVLKYLRYIFTFLNRPELIIINYLDHGPFNGTTMMIKRSNRWERNVVNETNFHFGFIKVKVDQLSDRPATP